MARVKVLQAMAGARHGGAEAFFLRLVPALARAGLEQRVVIRREPARAAALREAGIEPVELAFGGFFDFTTGSRLKREVERFAPGIVLTWMSRATEKCPEGPFVHVARLGGYYNLKYYRNCDHLIANTQDIVAYIKNQGWPPERVHYLPNFANDATAAPVARADLGTPDGVPVVLALGRLHENKGFDVLLKAMTQILDAHCWLAGEGPERAALEADTKWLSLAPRMHFLGWRDDVAALYAAADVLVCPSRHEPLGNVIIEAWARGVPVVAAASAGPMALIRNGENGILVPREDPGAIAKAVRLVIENRELALRLKEGGLATYRAYYTEQAVVNRYLEFFEKVAA